MPSTTWWSGRNIERVTIAASTQATMMAISAQIHSTPHAARRSIGLARFPARCIHQLLHVIEKLALLHDEATAQWHGM
ncbi:hypothetical protein [Paraburkholderia sp. Ac-20347]|uniref:hypothetical protein n=1 Tax=Paraburkholderia sp. Ac-20347 TaxID=2703892 RepID=UPI00198153A3|nr:hypothetical protein [Paraburkholderia sp. Ac-20347]